MISRLYIETAVAEHPVTRSIVARFANLPTVEIDRYGEVFNRNAQNFRLQKRQPALILAEKFSNYVLPAPPGYGIGHANNYYMSHMLNCVYDCRYCFLQGMYRSANYVVFVNFADFRTAMASVLDRHSGTTTCFFSGYDCDSLALEPVSGYVEDLLPFFVEHPQAFLELRTKSTQIRPLLRRPALPNVVVAYSLTPDDTARALEHKAPKVGRRLGAIQRLAEHGWPIGLRFDPLIYTADYKTRYRQLFDDVFSVLSPAQVHSVTFGPFRLPKPYFRAVQKLYPEEPLFANSFHAHGDLLAYPPEIEQSMREFCIAELAAFVPANVIFPSEF